MVAELEPPDLSTRLIVLANLIRDRGETVAPEAVRAIASRAVSNLRMLEGALTRVVALSSLTASKVTPETVADALPSAVAEAPTPAVEVERIQEAVAARLGLTRPQLLSTGRTAPVVRGRQLAMFLTRELTDLSLPAIAVAFNRRDHTTVMHAVKRVSERAQRDPKLTREIEALRSALIDRPPATRPSGHDRS
jgi:chromosomal replication initiator protein